MNFYIYMYMTYFFYQIPVKFQLTFTNIFPFAAIFVFANATIFVFANAYEVLSDSHTLTFTAIFVLSHL